jgi:hypothetical protein
MRRCAKMCRAFRDGVAGARAVRRDRARCRRVHEVGDAPTPFQDGTGVHVPAGRGARDRNRGLRVSRRFPHRRRRSRRALVFRRAARRGPPGESIAIPARRALLGDAQRRRVGCSSGHRPRVIDQHLGTLHCVGSDRRVPLLDDVSRVRNHRAAPGVRDRRGVRPVSRLRRSSCCRLVDPSESTGVTRARRSPACRAVAERAPGGRNPKT